MSSIFQGLVQSSTGLVNFSVGTGAIPIIAAEMRGLRINAVADAEGAFPVYASVGQASASVGSGGLSFDAYGRLRITTTVPGTIVQLPGGIIADETGSLVVFGPAEILYQGVALTYIGYVSALSQEPVPIFYWPGTHTLAATTGTDPTFTRATAATFEDFEGLIKTAESSEPRFVGARRVENLVGSSENMMGSEWLATGASPPTIADYQTIELKASSSSKFKQTVLSAAAIGEVVVQRVKLKGQQGDQINLEFVKNNGNSVGGIVITLTSDWVTYSASYTITDAGAVSIQISAYNSTAVTVNVSAWQAENVTGQTNQNPSEYVSTGVASATAPELVTNGDFATDSDWTKGAGVTISGGKANWNDTGNNLGITQGSLGFVVGLFYEVTYTVSNYVSGSVRVRYPNIAAQSTANGTYTVIVECTNTTLYMQGEGPAVAPANLSVDNISVKQAEHGANVDGVQYFNTLNANTVTAGVVTEATGSALTSATTQFGELHGGGGDYFSTPSVVTTWSELDIRVRATRSTTSNNVFMFNKAAGATRDFELYVTTTGALNFQYWDSSGTLRYTTTTSLIPFAVGELGWCRVTIDTATGDIKLYTADGNLEAPAISDYTQLGATQNPVGGATSLRDTPLAGYSVGAITAYPIYPFDGDIYRAQVFNEIDGTTPVVDFTPGSYVSGSTLVSSTSGETWTLNGNASVFQPPVDASGPFGYLAEKASTNLALQSEDFTTSWVAQGSTISANAAVAPDGTTTMDRVVVGTTTAIHNVYQNISTTVDTNYTYSVYMKDDGAGFGGISLGHGTNFVAVVVDLSTGLVTDTEVGAGSGTIVATGCEDVGNGIYRVWISGRIGNAAGWMFLFASDAAVPATWLSGRPSYTGVLGEDILVWGAQVE
ncbi:MAG: hypothetical protein HN738_10145 [Gammaproteobacteria bacterium]|nr:hypothetical protein [Gammaproteobacteria bacterium]